MVDYTSFYREHPYLTILGIICVIGYSIYKLIEWYPINSFEKFIKWSIIWILVAVVIIVLVFLNLIFGGKWSGNDVGILIIALIVGHELKKWEKKWAEKEGRRMEADRQIIEKLEDISHALSSIEKKIENVSDTKNP